MRKRAQSTGFRNSDRREIAQSLTRLLNGVAVRRGQLQRRQFKSRLRVAGLKPDGFLEAFRG
jgi:hypothetical protein